MTASAPNLPRMPKVKALLLAGIYAIASLQLATMRPDPYVAGLHSTAKLRPEGNRSTDEFCADPVAASFGERCSIEVARAHGGHVVIPMTVMKTAQSLVKGRSDISLDSLFPRSNVGGLIETSADVLLLPYLVLCSSNPTDPHAVRNRAELRFQALSACLELKT